QIGGGKIFQRAAKRSNRRAARARDDGLEVVRHVAIIVLRSRTSQRLHMRARSLLLLVLFACFTAFVFAGPARAQTRRAMTVDDVLDLVQVSAPRISPDGRRVLYTKSELAPWKDNKRTSTIWIVDAD